MATKLYKEGEAAWFKTESVASAMAAGWSTTKEVKEEVKKPEVKKSK